VPDDGSADIGLVLMVSRDEFDRLPPNVPPASSIAIFAASTDPTPACSAYRLDMSLSTPILIGLFGVCAWTAAPPRTVMEAKMASAFS
jgi:hypothetical protein